jgi:hypothetical protein
MVSSTQTIRPAEAGLNKVNDLDGLLPTMLTAEQANQVFDGFEIARSPLDGAKPVLFRLLTAV